VPFLPRLPIININLIRIFGVLLILQSFILKKNIGNVWKLVFVCNLLIILRIWIDLYFGKNFSDVFTESFSLLCMLSAIIVAKGSYRYISQLYLLRYLIISSMLGGFFSILLGFDLVLFSFSYKINLTTIAGFDRTGWVCDSYLAMLGVIGCFSLINISNNKKDFYLCIVGLIFSYITIVFGMFRSYIVITAAISLIFIYYYLTNMFIKPISLLVAFLMVLFLCLPNFYIKQFENKFDRIANRIKITSKKDYSYLARKGEMEIESQLIKEKPLIGNGFGLAKLHNVYVFKYGSIPLYGHNLFTGLSARLGIVLTLFIITLMLYFGIENLLYYISSPNNNNKILFLAGFIAFIATIVLGLVINPILMSYSTPILAIFIKQKDCPI